ncbi:hypothetical protein [uncultured Victivallis sp.]|uniref:hypothetical protein n=1 Tax=uncultured Victivallis sp. TaxID=354118 RepID=UPI0025F75F65|nr:hypothetical protein [uncultured Victivallis sp.]
MATICPYCNIEVSESAIEAEDGCCPECGSVISASSSFLGEDPDYDDDLENDDLYDDFDEDDDDIFERDEFDDDAFDDEDLDAEFDDEEFDDEEEEEF